jgi:hypothetical protein
VFAVCRQVGGSPEVYHTTLHGIISAKLRPSAYSTREGPWHKCYDQATTKLLLL